MRYLTIILLALSVNTVQALQVLSSSPSPNSLGASALLEITIVFDDNVDPSTISSDHIMVFGRWSGPAELDFELDGPVLTFSAAESFFAGEYVMVGLSSGLTSESSEPLEHGYSFGFWVESQPGSMEVTDVGHLEVRQPGETFIQCYGAYAGDLNGDGWCDLTVVNEDSEDLRVFMSDQGTFSTFSLQDLPLGNKPSSNEGADFNGDGEIDLVIGNTQGDMMSVVLGEGGGVFGDEVIYEADQGVRGVTILDIEGDGDMDIVTANRIGSNMSVYFNDGNADFSSSFTMSSPLSGETAIVAADMDEDGLMDLVVGGYVSDDIGVFINDGEGGFDLLTEVDTGDAPWMITMGDIDLDGHVDIAAASSGDNAISIHYGDGQGGLSAADTYPAGAFPLAIDLGDLDGDGDLDVISSNYSGGTYTLYENDGTGGYINGQTLQAEIAGSCAIFHDRNNDGVTDITGIDELADVLIFFENSPSTIEELESGSVLLYPNPGSEMFILEVEAQSSALILIMIDTQGKQVDQRVLPAGNTQLQWKAPDKAGEYFILNKADHRRLATFTKH